MLQQQLRFVKINFFGINAQYALSYLHKQFSQLGLKELAVIKNKEFEEVVVDMYFKYTIDFQELIQTLNQLKQDTNDICEDSLGYHIQNFTLEATSIELS